MQAGCRATGVVCFQVSTARLLTPKLPFRLLILFSSLFLELPSYYWCGNEFVREKEPRLYMFLRVSKQYRTRTDCKASTMMAFRGDVTRALIFNAPAI